MGESEANAELEYGDQIARLHSLLVEVSNDLPKPDYGKLHALLLRVRMTITEGFGESSIYLSDLKAISFRPGAFYSRQPADAGDRAWNAGKTKLENLLKVLMEDLHRRQVKELRRNQQPPQQKELANDKSGKMPVCEETKSQTGNTGETPDKPPNITEFRKWAFFHIFQNVHHLKAAWLPVLLIAGLAAYLGWLATTKFEEQAVIAKNAKIELLEASQKEKQSKIEELQTEKDRVTKQNQELKSSASENAMPLKKRTLILAAQLSDFATRCSTNSNPFDSVLVREYNDRFDHRVSRTIQDFDETGLHSDVMFHLFNAPGFSLPIPATNLQTMAQEFQKLAKSLKDDSQPTP